MFTILLSSLFEVNINVKVSMNNVLNNSLMLFIHLMLLTKTCSLKEHDYICCTEIKKMCLQGLHCRCWKCFIFLENFTSEVHLYVLNYLKPCLHTPLARVSIWLSSCGQLWTFCSLPLRHFSDCESLIPDSLPIRLFDVCVICLDSCFNFNCQTVNSQRSTSLNLQLCFFFCQRWRCFQLYVHPGGQRYLPHFRAEHHGCRHRPRWRICSWRLLGELFIIFQLYCI